MECGKAISDRYTNICPDGHNSLLRTEYKISRQIRKLSGMGMFNYIDWLLVDAAIPIGASPITYKSEGLGKELGIKSSAQLALDVVGTELSEFVRGYL